MAVVGVGVDVVEIERMRAALVRTPGLAGRLFTAGERARCVTASGVRADRLAARFAAKEAVAKAFGTGVRGFAFTDVEVRTEPNGRPVIALHGPAVALAARLGVERVHVSLSTTHRIAVASVVLEG